ncbi:hypothetical protein F4780DRAFT_726707 [Xylariomycetidae sp. FL0641]|nr:hypothetical protein F4780DRAFT_726707 [Xylariomycetidae sp. FL0641]
MPLDWIIPFDYDRIQGEPEPLEGQAMAAFTGHPLATDMARWQRYELRYHRRRIAEYSLAPTINLFALHWLNTRCVNHEVSMGDIIRKEYRRVGELKKLTYIWLDQVDDPACCAAIRDAMMANACMAGELWVLRNCQGWDELHHGNSLLNAIKTMLDQNREEMGGRQIIAVLCSEVVCGGGAYYHMVVELCD